MPTRLDTPQKILNHLRKWYPRLLRLFIFDGLVVEDGKLFLYYPTFDRPYDNGGFEISIKDTGSLYVKVILVNGDTDAKRVLEKRTVKTVEDLVEFMLGESGYLHCGYTEYKEKTPVPKSEWRKQYRHEWEWA